MHNVYVSANILEMEVSADWEGPSSGDHGGHISLRLSNGGSTCWNVLVNGQPVEADNICIQMTGCTEFETFTEAMNDVSHYLNKILLDQVEWR